MRRADRLFDIIQALRAATGPLTAAQLGAQLEVTPRTVYRDIASLQASRVPIEGAAGLGYVLRQGFDLPPLMFTRDEIEAILVGARLIRRTGDPGLQAAAAGVLSKLSVALPPHPQEDLLGRLMNLPALWPHLTEPSKLSGFSNWEALMFRDGVTWRAICRHFALNGSAFVTETLSKTYKLSDPKDSGSAY